MPTQVIPGIHHVTAIAGDPQANLDFYTQVLGLRLVKKTVNFDDPGSYHFYFGDAVGTPGTILTFFPWPGAYPGRVGDGMAAATSFAIPAPSLDYWLERLAELHDDFDAPQPRLGEEVLTLRDPDGLTLELIAADNADTAISPAAERDWEYVSVPAEHRLRSFHSVTLCVADVEPTAKLLAETFGYKAAGEETDRLRFRSPSGTHAAIVDLRRQSDPPPHGRMGAGTVHHVAFRARDAQQQLEWREAIAALGFNVTPVLDRQYFRSIYFREPGGVLFEIATDPPGFQADEVWEELGTHLKLPPWLESQRQHIERRLPPVSLAKSASARRG
jgi:catechol 2,3-dioxygenase-like lactoylglutathione lyase family enzyme